MYRTVTSPHILYRERKKEKRILNQREKSGFKYPRMPLTPRESCVNTFLSLFVCVLMNMSLLISPITIRDFVFTCLLHFTHVGFDSRMEMMCVERKKIRKRKRFVVHMITYGDEIAQYFANYR